MANDSTDKANLKTIWLDGDACPREIFDMMVHALKRGPLVLNVVTHTYRRLPPHPRINLVLVKKGFDAADDHIVEQIQPGQLLVTQDIPLAALALKQKAFVLSTKGELLTDTNIGERLAARDLATHRRETEFEATRGPAPFNNKIKQQFANSFDRILTTILKSP